MTQTRERPEVRTFSENEMQVHEAPLARKPAWAVPARRHAPWMALVMAFVVLVAGLVLALLAVGDSETTVLPSDDTALETPEYSFVSEYRSTPDWALTLTPSIEPLDAPSVGDGVELLFPPAYSDVTEYRDVPNWALTLAPTFGDIELLEAPNYSFVSEHRNAPDWGPALGAPLVEDIGPAASGPR